VRATTYSILVRLYAGLVALVVCLFVVTTAHAQAQTHVVQPGENLFRIGLRYGITVDQLMRANGLTSIYIYAGQTLVIPGGDTPAPAPAPAPEQPQPAPQAVAPNGEPVYHIVQRGETLFTIGLRYNLPWTKIALANKIFGDRVFAGARLLIPTTASTAPQPAPTEAAPAPNPEPAAAPVVNDGNIVHTVQRGDTLFTIGLKYNVQWTSILALNNLATEYIFAGQRLKIPAPGQVVPAANVAPVGGQGPVSGYSGKYFLIDLSEQRLYAFEGQTLVRSTLISSGRWPTPTVLGTYQVYARYEATRMVGPGYDLPNVPYTMYFYKGYGLHGTYWHNNFGTPMSHGCVNMPTPEAQWAFNWSTYGTTVIVQQ
jgi:LysM repeat protein